MLYETAEGSYGDQVDTWTILVYQQQLQPQLSGLFEVRCDYAGKLRTVFFFQ